MSLREPLKTKGEGSRSFVNYSTLVKLAKELTPEGKKRRDQTALSLESAVQKHTISSDEKRNARK